MFEASIASDMYWPTSALVAVSIVSRVQLAAAVQLAAQYASRAQWLAAGLQLPSWLES